LREHNQLPETVRNMPTFDVYMILCGDVAKIMNDYEEERQKKFKAGGGDLSKFGITMG